VPSYRSSAVFLDFAGRILVEVRDTTVDVVSKDRNCQYDSYHGKPPRILARDVDSQITTQMGIRFFTFVVLSAGISMTFIVVFGVVVSACIFHCVSPSRLLGYGLLSFLKNKLAMEYDLTTGDKAVAFDRLKHPKGNETSICQVHSGVPVD